MDRFSRLLGKFSRKKSEAKLAQQLNKSVEAPEANANGTSGYLIKEGKNAGKVLKHLKTDKNQNLIFIERVLKPLSSFNNLIDGKTKLL